MAPDSHRSTSNYRRLKLTALLRPVLYLQPRQHHQPQALVLELASELMSEWESELVSASDLPLTFLRDPRWHDRHRE